MQLNYNSELNCNSKVLVIKKLRKLGNSQTNIANNYGRIYLKHNSKKKLREVLRW